jgi:hypothetical protein
MTHNYRSEGFTPIERPQQMADHARVVELEREVTRLESVLADICTLTRDQWLTPIETLLKIRARCQEVQR